MDKANSPPCILLISLHTTRWENKTEGEIDRGGSGGQIGGKKDTKREN